MRRAVAGVLWLALLASPMARADDPACRVELGRGWPPATENYGTAVEKLFAGNATAGLSFTLLPKNGAESGLLLIPGEAGGDWTLRYAEADERVRTWSGDRLELRTQQDPETSESPIPDAVARRVVDDWRAALAAVAPEGGTAPYSEDDTWLFAVGDLRVSGLRPGCELGELLREQIDLLVEASDEGEEKRAKRWRQLGESLDRMRDVIAALPAPAAP